MTPPDSIDVVLATGNAHKVVELSRMFDCARAASGEGGPAVRLFSAGHVGGMPVVKEDAETFAGNARQKALALREVAPVPYWVLADDSGLCCDALGGRPGVASARFAGLRASDGANRAKLLEALRRVPGPGRGAYFLCHLCLIPPTGGILSFEGRCAGRVLEAEEGEGGFGYDSIFQADGCAGSFATLAPEEKDRLSHRGRAVRELLAELSMRWRAGTF
ncbi:MAG: non-canonical purine NTP pyrophosphatase [Puniceicoccales bacterium]|jgi:XTP/dITP diphosphohydrolase|nr:non-canonical purine NTP pyrophosphatase [Puniceicoccales bacterium]